MPLYKENRIVRFLWNQNERFKHFMRKRRGSIREFDFDPRSDIRVDIKSKYNYDGDLLTYFVETKGHLIHKWHHYIPLYDRYFSRFRGKEIRFLEIGVSKGGSLQMWRKYFGEKAIIYGIDINPDCSSYNGQFAQVRIGSQTDSTFLGSVISEMGGVDIILDDGSHNMDHVITTLRYLFPKLNEQGIYLIEDLHTAYWSRFGGGYKKSKNFFNRIRDVIDDMHHWYHTYGIKEPMISHVCTGIHIHDSVVVLEKDAPHKPSHSQIS